MVMPVLRQILAYFFMLVDDYQVIAHFKSIPGRILSQVASISLVMLSFMVLKKTRVCKIKSLFRAMCMGLKCCGKSNFQLFYERRMLLMVWS